jgi:hypothetical protein
VTHQAIVARKEERSKLDQRLTLANGSFGAHVGMAGALATA